MSGFCHRLLGQACVLLWLILTAGAASDADAGESTAVCLDEDMLLHVRAQFARYGPRSRDKEYFGFVYRHEGRVGSAVTSGVGCGGQPECTVNPAFARRRIPKGAVVLGEWHTHPHIGAHGLSMEDVKGANSNRRIRCYAAFYSAPDGTIYRWSVEADSILTAMTSRTQAGNYRERAADL